MPLRASTCRVMAEASSCSPKNTMPTFSFDSRRASSSLCVRSAISIAGIQGAGDLRHPAHRDRIRGRDHQHAGVRDMRLDQDGGVGGISRDRGNVLFAQLAAPARGSARPPRRGRPAPTAPGQCDARRGRSPPAPPARKGSVRRWSSAARRADRRGAPGAGRGASGRGSMRAPAAWRRRPAGWRRSRSGRRRRSGFVRGSEAARAIRRARRG